MNKFWWILATLISGSDLIKEIVWYTYMMVIKTADTNVTIGMSLMARIPILTSSILLAIAIYNLKLTYNKDT